MKKILLCFISIVCCFYFPSAQSKRQLVADHFNALTSTGQFNGAVLVAEKGKIIYENQFGYADVVNRQRIGFSTRFALASISKTLVATAIMQLSQQKKLNVNDPVQKHLPAFPYPDILIRHLLSHTSGLPSYNAYFAPLLKADSTAVFTNADFLKVVSSENLSLLYKPGDKENYDNVNYIVLALLIEKLAGERYTAYIEKNIMKPAGISMQAIPAADQLKKKIYPNFAYPYLQPQLYSDSMVKAADIPYIVSYWSAYQFSGFGQYVGTVWDLYKYANAYRGNKLFSAATKQEMFQRVKLNNGSPGKFALGWEISKDSSLGKIVYHNGNSFGLSCILLQNISKDQVIIVFDNIHNNNSQQTAFDLLHIINGKSLPKPRSSIAWIYGKTLVSSGAEKARDTLYKMKKDSSRYYLSEDELNLLGYDFLGSSNKPNPYQFADNPMPSQALETFKLNVELFPSSWNVYDSYGEALLAAGHKKEAIAMYQRSVELNPQSKGGKEILERLMKE